MRVGNDKNGNAVVFLEANEKLMIFPADNAKKIWNVGGILDQETGEPIGLFVQEGERK